MGVKNNIKTGFHRLGLAILIPCIFAGVAILANAGYSYITRPAPNVFDAFDSYSIHDLSTLRKHVPDFKKIPNDRELMIILKGEFWEKAKAVSKRNAVRDARDVAGIALAIWALGILFYILMRTVSWVITGFIGD